MLRAVKVSNAFQSSRAWLSFLNVALVVAASSCRLARVACNEGLRVGGVGSVDVVAAVGSNRSSSENSRSSCSSSSALTCAVALCWSKKASRRCCLSCCALLALLTSAVVGLTTVGGTTSSGMLSSTFCKAFCFMPRVATMACWEASLVASMACLAEMAVGAAPLEVPATPAAGFKDTPVGVVSSIWAATCSGVAATNC